MSGGGHILASADKSEKTLVVLQPGYLPWLGFFDQLARSDVFVFYDDVQYDKHGWRNRNRVKSPGGPHWLTVPVLHKGLGKPLILETKVNNDSAWGRKHIGTIRQFYRDAPFLAQYLPELEELLLRHWDLLVDLDIAVTRWLAEKLGLQREIVRSSELGIEGGKSERLVNICRRFGADHYLSGDSAKDYLDTELFARNGIKVSWQQFQHPIYTQQFGEFLPYLSALDLLLNMGEKSGSFFGKLRSNEV